MRRTRVLAARYTSATMKNTPIFDAVLFDMDGVIADSELHWDEIDATMLRGFGIDYHGEHKNEVHGKGFDPAMTFYKTHYKLAPPLGELVAQRRDIAATYYAQHVALFDDVKTVLQELRAMPVKIALATSSLRVLALSFLARHDIEKYFETIVAGDEVEHTKPAPDLYLKAAEKLGIAPQKCLVVEDSLAGVDSGKAAGMRVAAIPDARFVSAADYTRADFVLSRLREIVPIVRGES